MHRGAGQHSRETTEKYENVRKSIADFVGASETDYVIFTKNTTEAINHAAELWSHFPGTVLLSDIEHSSNLLPWLKNGSIIQYRSDQDASSDLARIGEVLQQQKNKPVNERIKLVAATGSSNVTGYKPPIHDIADLAQRYGAKILVDVCQLIPHEKIDMLPVSDGGHLYFITFSGHKMYAPFGTGVLVGPKEFFDSVSPYQIGGGNLTYITPDLAIKKSNTVQVHDPGTPNAMGAIALEQAIIELHNLGQKIHDYEHALVGKTIQGLKKIKGVKIYLKELHGSVIPFDINTMPSKLVADVLANEYAIGTRSGSFCTYELIRKLKNIPASDEVKIERQIDEGIITDIPSIVRASFSIYNRPDDAKRFLAATKEIASKGMQYYNARYEMDKRTGDWRPKD